MIRTAACTLAALVAAAVPSFAPAQTAVPDGVVAARILPGWRAADGRHMAALEVTLAPGWKTYWRAPGDAGIPPAFQWTAAENVEGLRLHWPVPEVSHDNGMRSIGYSGTVVIPMELSTPAAAAGLLEGSVDLGICADICIPMTLPLAAELPPQGQRHPAIVAALIDRPATADEAGVRGVSCEVSPAEGRIALTLTLDMPPAGGREEVVIEAGPGLWVSEPVARREGGQLRAAAEIVATGAAPLALDRSALRITVLGAERAVDIRGCD